jgi:hypothetical protein
MTGFRAHRAAAPALALCLLLLAACGSVHEQEGRGYMPASEVTVSRAVPLTVPPDYGARPESTTQAEATVVAAGIAGTEIDVTTLDATLGEQNLLVRAGVLEANPAIRQTLNKENALLTGPPELVDALLFGNYANTGSVEVTEGPEIGSDVAIEQGTPVEDESWFGSVFDIF